MGPNLKPALLIIAFSALFMAAACTPMEQSVSAPPRGQTPAPERLSVRTFLISAALQNGRRLNAPLNHNRLPVLEIEGQTVSGIAACNNFSGQLKNEMVADAHGTYPFEFTGSVASTRMYCMGEGIMAFENAVNGQFANARLLVAHSDGSAEILDGQRRVIIWLRPTSDLANLPTPK